MQKKISIGRYIFSFAVEKNEYGNRTTYGVSIAVGIESKPDQAGWTIGGP